MGNMGIKQDSKGDCRFCYCRHRHLLWQLVGANGNPATGDRIHGILSGLWTVRLVNVGKQKVAIAHKVALNAI